jgi:hypothetical protein
VGERRDSASGRLARIVASSYGQEDLQLVPQVFETQLGGQTLTIETGRLARLAGGSVTVRYGFHLNIGTAQPADEG